MSLQMFKEIYISGNKISSKYDNSVLVLLPQGYCAYLIMLNINYMLLISLSPKIINLQL